MDVELTPACLLSVKLQRNQIFGGKKKKKKAEVQVSGAQCREVVNITYVICDNFT